MNYGCDNLSEYHFYDVAHAKIFKAIVSRIKKGDRIDMFILHSDLGDQVPLEKLNIVFQNVGYYPLIEEYCEKVESAYRARSALNSFSKCVSDINSGKDPCDVLLEISQKTCELLSTITSKKMRTCKDILSDLDHGKSFIQVLDENRAIYRSGGKVNTGVCSGFKDLDSITRGFRKGNVVVVAGRPGMGKTSIMLNMAQNIAIDQGIPVGFFSLEMMESDILKKIVSSVARVNSNSFDGAFSDSDRVKILDAIEKVEKAKIVIDDKAGISLRELSAKARRMKDVHGIEIIFIDYIQIMKPDSKGKIRELEISEICAGLQILAKELQIPIVVGAQLSRKVEERTEKKPLMSDLRESGTIEQTADLVIFLMREEYYDPNKKPGIAKLIVSKNRHGETGEFELSFRKKFGRFEDLVKLDLNKNDEILDDPRFK
jgi:replicative DNA helicase